MRNSQQPANPSFSTSGKRDSNSRPSAWEADALPTELFPQYFDAANVATFRFIYLKMITFLVSKTMTVFTYILGKEQANPC